MSKIVNMALSTFNVSSKFEREISSNKRYREFEILWFVDKAPVLFLFTCVLHWFKFQSNVFIIVDNIFYKQIELVFLFDNKPFCQTNGKCLHHWKEFEEQDSSFVYITINSRLLISLLTLLLTLKFIIQYAHTDHFILVYKK